MTLATALAILGLIVLASACALLVIQRCEIADLQNEVGLHRDRLDDLDQRFPR